MASVETEILFMLGELKKGLERVEQLQEEERREAKENRSKIHARLDQHVRDVGEIEEKVIIIGQTLGQQRETIETLSKDVRPALSEWARIKTLGWGFSFLLTAIGVTAGSLLMWFSDTAATALRRWLRID